MVSLQARAHRVQFTLQRAILSFSDVLVKTVANVSKRAVVWTRIMSIDAFPMTTQTQPFENALLSTRSKVKLIAVKRRLKPFQNCSRYRKLF